MHTLLRTAAVIAGVTFAFALLPSAGTAHAATLNVGSAYTYKNIQSAVNAAKSGDTIAIYVGGQGNAGVFGAGSGAR